MGVLWYDARKTSALASFDKGIVYLGDGMFREQIGRYDSEFIYDKYGKTVAKIVGNTANNPALWSAESYCTSDCSRIYKGGSTYNATLASYDGESDGALAAAVLYFNLNNAERNSDNSQGINNNTKTHSNSDSNPPIGIPFDGSFIVIVLLVLADTFFFLFYRLGASDAVPRGSWVTLPGAHRSFVRHRSVFFAENERQFVYISAFRFIGDIPRHLHPNADKCVG